MTAIEILKKGNKGMITDIKKAGKEFAKRVCYQNTYIGNNGLHG